MGVFLLLMGCSALASVGFGTEPPPGCAEIIADNGEYLRCMNNFNSIFTEMAATGQIWTAADFCFGEGKAAVGCIMDYLGKCPHLFSGDDESGAYDMLWKIQFVGNVEAFCDIVVEGCVTQFLQCAAPLDPKKGEGDMFSKVYSLSDVSTTTDLSPSYNRTPTFYSNIPKQLTILCGPMKEMLNCALEKDVKDPCPETVQYIEQKISDEISKQNMVDSDAHVWWPDFPSYEKAKKYITEKCPSFPSDFTERSLPCIESRTKNTSFLECYAQVSSDQNDGQSCEAYNVGKACITTHVGPPHCEEKDAKILIDASQLFSTAIPESCSRVGEGSTLHISVSTITALACSCLFLFVFH